MTTMVMPRPHPAHDTGMDSHAPEVTSHSAVLMVLRVALHVMVAALLVVGLSRYLAGMGGASSHGTTLITPPAGNNGPDTAPAMCAIGGVVLLAIVYMGGTIWENRYTKHNHTHAGRGHQGGRRIPDPRRYAPWWIAAVTGLWFLLILISPNFVWLALPIMFLCMHVWPSWKGIVAVIAVTVMAAAVPYLHLASQGRTDGYSLGIALGPTFGAAFALVISWAYRALYNESQRYLHIAREYRSLANQYRRTADALKASQAERATTEHTAGRMEERERLAREIHDTVAQGLSSIVLMSRSLQIPRGSADPATGTVPTDHADLATFHHTIATIEATATDNLAEARRFIHNMTQPGDVNIRHHLEAACRQTQAQALAEGQHLTCEFRYESNHGDDATPPIPDTISHTLIRVVQSTMANVRLRARATRAVVTLGLWDDTVTLDVVDNGCGFNTDTSTLGFGLTSVRQRAEALDGTLTVESTPGHGTAIALRLPLTSQHAITDDTERNTP